MHSRRYILGGMTLREILNIYNIQTLKAFADLLDCTAQNAWPYWHGYRKVSGPLALKIHKVRPDIPLEDLLNVELTARGKAKQAQRAAQQAAKRQKVSA
jgi:hypothetical protein